MNFDKKKAEEFARMMAEDDVSLNPSLNYEQQYGNWLNSASKNPELLTGYEGPLLANPSPAQMETPVLRQPTEEITPYSQPDPIVVEADRDTEDAFSLGGWLKDMGNSVLGGIDSGTSKLGNFMQENPALIASVASALGRYAWDPDVGRDQIGQYSGKRAIWDSLNTGVNTRLGIEQQRLYDKELKRGQLQYKDGGFYNIRPVDTPQGPSWGIDRMMQTKPTEPNYYEKKLFEEGLVRGRPSKDSYVKTGTVEYQPLEDDREQGFMFNRHGKNQWSKWGEPRTRKGAGGTSGPLSPAGKIYSDLQTAIAEGDEKKIKYYKDNMFKKISSSKDVYGAEKDLRKEFTTGSKDFVSTRDAYTRIMAVGQDPSGFGDLALIFNYMKMLDPNSVVRESEFATAQNTGSIGQRFIAMFNRVKLGMRLEEGQRKELMQATNALWGTSKFNHDKFTEAHKRIAQGTKEGLFPNLDPERTYVNYAEPSPEEIRSTASSYRNALANVGIGRDQYERQGYVKALGKSIGTADANQGKNFEITEGTHKGLYKSELNANDGRWYWVQHQ